MVKVAGTVGKVAGTVVMVAGKEKEVAVKNEAHKTRKLDAKKLSLYGQAVLLGNLKKRDRDLKG